MPARQQGIRLVSRGESILRMSDGSCHTQQGAFLPLGVSDVLTVVVQPPRLMLRRYLDVPGVPRKAYSHVTLATLRDVVGAHVDASDVGRQAQSWPMTQAEVLEHTCTTAFENNRLWAGLVGRNIRQSVPEAAGPHGQFFANHRWAGLAPAAVVQAVSNGQRMPVHVQRWVSFSLHCMGQGARRARSRSQH